MDFPTNQPASISALSISSPSLFHVDDGRMKWSLRLINKLWKWQMREEKNINAKFRAFNLCIFFWNALMFFLGACLTLCTNALKFSHETFSSRALSQGLRSRWLNFEIRLFGFAGSAAASFSAKRWHFLSCVSLRVFFPPSSQLCCQPLKYSEPKKI